MTEFLEEWKPVVGYEGIYAISNYGRVKRVAGSHQTPKDRMLKNCIIKDGYLGVSLCRDNKKENSPIHRLVARAFIGERPERHDINHKDGNKENPSIWNLEYVTASENQYHAYKNYLKKPLVGERHQNAKLTEENVREILKTQKSFSPAYFAEKYSVSTASISDIIVRRTWKHVI